MALQNFKKYFEGANINDLNYNISPKEDLDALGF